MKDSCVHLCISWLQECQFLPVHTKQCVCGKWLRGAEALPWLFSLFEWHGCSVAWLLQPPQARETPFISAWWLPAGGLLRPSTGLQLWGACSRGYRRSRYGQWRGVHLQNPMQRPCYHAEQWAPTWQLWFPYDARLLLPDSSDIWQESQCLDPLQLRVLLCASSPASKT